jgi:small-conductance mechanosensitive channel
MSFREKSAWVTLCALVIVSFMYWLHVPSLIETRPPHRWVLLAMCLSLVAYLLIELVAYVLLRLRNPQDANEPRDEREQLIDLKSLRIAHYVFIIGALAGIFVMLHLVGGDGPAVGTIVCIAFVLSQIVKHASRIVYFRRGL